MDNKFEEVTKLIAKFLKDFDNETHEYPITFLAHQICQLFEPDRGVDIPEEAMKVLREKIRPILRQDITQLFRTDTWYFEKEVDNKGLHISAEEAEKWLDQIFQVFKQVAIPIIEKRAREKLIKFIEKRRDACQLNDEQVDCRLCLSELLKALKSE